MEQSEPFQAVELDLVLLSRLFFLCYKEYISLCITDD